MAPSKTTQAVNPPATLPGNFFENSGPAETLPGDFDFGDKKAAPYTPPDTRNGVQKFVDNLTTVTPEQDAKTPSLLKPLAHFGAGAIQGATEPFVHPLNTLESIGRTIAHPIDTSKSMVQGAEEDPAKAVGNLVGGADLGGALAEAGAPLINKIPSTKRAGGVFQSIRQQADAAGTQVPLTNTEAPLQRFEDLTQAGGRRSKPFTQLYQRATDPTAPLSFGEGRDFYTNVTDAAHKTPLEKLMGRGMKPTMLRQAGMVKGGLNDDLTSAADTLGRGEDYTGAMKEYANAKKIQKYTRAAALLGAGEAARRTGLLGNWIHRAALTGQ